MSNNKPQKAGEEIRESAEKGHGGYPSLKTLIGRKGAQISAVVDKKLAGTNSDNSAPKFPDWIRG